MPFIFYESRANSNQQDVSSHFVRLPVLVTGDVAPIQTSRRQLHGCVLVLGILVGTAAFFTFLLSVPPVVQEPSVPGPAVAVPHPIRYEVVGFQRGERDRVQENCEKSVSINSLLHLRWKSSLIILFDGFSRIKNVPDVNSNSSGQDTHTCHSVTQ